MPEASGDRSAEPVRAWDAAAPDLLGLHAAPPPHRSRLLGYALPAALVAGAVAYAVTQLWLLAAMFVVLAVSMIWRTRGRLDGAFTEVTERGVTVHTRDTHHNIAWEDIQEVYPRAPWAPFPTLRLASGSTVALPGVSDELAPGLERARIDQAAASVTRRPRTTRGQGRGDEA